MIAVKIKPSILKKIRLVSRLALAYEKETGRKLGITGEVGEVLIASKLKLLLPPSNSTPGYDAIDARGKTYQIKAKRFSTRITGRIGKLSKHKFDYLVIAFISADYKLVEVYKIPQVLVTRIVKEYGAKPPIRVFRNSKWQLK